jgi:NarL family two-component system response regulator LiaR
MSSGHPIRLAVFNDYPLVTAGLAALLEPYVDRVRVSEHVEQVPARGSVDVILFDTFGRPDALDLLEGFLVTTGSKVLVYAWAVDPRQVRRFISHGAAGCVPKTTAGDVLVKAVERAHLGLPLGIEELEGRAPMLAWPGQDVGLSEREAEVLAFIVLGLSNNEIADRCYLSINSVKTYIRMAYRKVGVTRRSAAILWGLEHGFRSRLGLQHAVERD